MKPTEWDQMEPEERKEIASALFRSFRGSYIIGQALALAADALRAKKYPEESNAQDMEILSTLFFPYKEVQAVTVPVGQSPATPATE